jgi:hypothetical protein
MVSQGGLVARFRSLPELPRDLANSYVGYEAIMAHVSFEKLEFVELNKSGSERQAMASF